MNIYKRYRFPSEIIQYAVWLYHRFNPSHRDIEDIIESPNYAHWKFYWEHVTNFESGQEKMSKHTLEDKITLLKKES